MITKFLTYIFILLFTFTTTVNGTTSVSLKHTGNDKEQITRATIGEGVIEVAGGSDLTGLIGNGLRNNIITKSIENTMSSKSDTSIYFGISGRM